MSCDGTNNAGTSGMDAIDDVSQRRQGIHLCDEQTKLRLANEIVEAINHCLLDKMAKTSGSEGHLLPSPNASTSAATADRLGADKSLESATETIDFGDTSEHSSSIRAFKRLGAYCTLRPEQRRKHLLKALPTLRNSRILQTLLASADSQPSAVVDTTSPPSNKHVIDDLLSNIDHIIGGDASKGVSAVNECNGDGRLAPVSDVGDAKNSILLDPKIEDCLRELDVYLEEIDRDYAMACAYESSATSSNYGKMAQRTVDSDESLTLLDNMESVDDELHSERNGGSAAGNDIVQTQRFSGDNSHMMRTLSSSDTNINSNQCDTTMNNLLLFKEKADEISATSNNGACSSGGSGSNAMKRGHRTRNTIGGGASAGKSLRSNPLHRFNGTRDAANRSSNWRRSSMRKTKPIILPQTDDDLRPEVSPQYEAPPRPDALVESLTSEPQPPNYFPLNVETSAEVAPTPNEASAVDLHSLNNEFLTTILTSPRAMCEANSIEAHSPECRTMLNEANVNNEIARPRQMGRRSEVRSRIVSITAERNAAGNQVSSNRNHLSFLSNSNIVFDFFHP